MKTKKGQLSIGSLLPIGITFVVLAIALGLGATVLDSIQDTQIDSTARCGLNSTGGTGGTLLYDGCGYDYNVSSFGLDSVDEVSSWMPTVALVVVAVVIIGLVMLFMRNRA